MKTKSTSSTLLFLLLIVAVTFLLSDCVFKKKASKKELPFAENEQIEVNKQDAKLLVDITKLNLDLLEDCKNSEYKEVNDNLKEIQATQQTINESLNQLGMQKLIMLPDVLLNPFQSNSVTLQSIINKEMCINKVISKIKKQIKLFENLEQNTIDVDIKILAIQSKTKLELSLLQLEYTQTNTNI